MTKRRRRGLAVWIGFGLWGVLPLGIEARETGDDLFSLARESISGEDLTRHGRFLSSDELEGRDGGSEGEGLAALYLASEFRRLGLLPGGADGTYFQPFRTRRGRDTFNVLGLLPGADPEVRDEILVVGGHYDHIGLNRNGEICNGADDNASGTAAVLELVEAFSLAPPRRSIVFMGFAAEEQGLLGSRHYCDAPLYPLDQTVAMVNLDMIGRSKDDYLFIGGAGTSPLFRPLIEKTNQEFGFSLEVKDPGGAPSDNLSFFNQGVPVLFLFTGIHEDYNQPSDDWDRVNVAGLEKIARFAFEISAELANRAERPEFINATGMALPDAMMRMRRGGGQSAGRSRPRLGIRLGEAEDGVSGVVVGEVSEGSAAEAAGLETGDRIVEFGGAEIEGAGDLLEKLGETKFGTTVELVVVRRGAKKSLEVEFPARSSGRE